MLFGRKSRAHPELLHVDDEEDKNNASREKHRARKKGAVFLRAVLRVVLGPRRSVLKPEDRAAHNMKQEESKKPPLDDPDDHEAGQELSVFVEGEPVVGFQQEEIPR